VGFIEAIKEEEKISDDQPTDFNLIVKTKKILKASI
jgi:hypothetical protein